MPSGHSALSYKLSTTCFMLTMKNCVKYTLSVSKIVLFRVGINWKNIRVTQFIVHYFQYVSVTYSALMFIDDNNTLRCNCSCLRLSKILRESYHIRSYKISFLIDIEAKPHHCVIFLQRVAEMFFKFIIFHYNTIILFFKAMLETACYLMRY